jgi:hypothetical protein
MATKTSRRTAGKSTAQQPPAPKPAAPATGGNLEQIAQDAIGLYSGNLSYPNAAKQYERAKGHRQLAVEGARRYGWALYTDPSGPDLQLQTERCARHWQTLAHLRVAVAGLFPSLELPWVSDASKPWHEREDMNWPQARKELQQIVFAAITAGSQGTPPAGAPLAAPAPAKKKLRTNELMILTLEKVPEAANWSITQWQEAIGRGRATIQNTGQWAKLQAAHALVKLDRLTRQESLRSLNRPGIDRRKQGRNLD